jgi:FkbM family methyltransferase
VTASLSKEVVETLWTILAIARHHRGAHRNDLLRGFLGAQLRRLQPGTRNVPGRLRLLGSDVAYFSSQALAILINEVLVEQAYYLDLPAERPFIIDGGANIGLSILLFKRLHPSCRILGFEPDPDTYALLEENVSSNGLENVELVNAALYGTEGELELCVDEVVPGNLGMSTRPVPNLQGRRRVKAKTLSTYLTHHVDLLKLDIEGVEVDVVQEAAGSGTLEQVDQIVMEYHHHMEPGEDRLGSMLATLERHGFGYQVSARPALPFRKGEFCSMFVYAYQNRSRLSPPVVPYR